MYALLRQFLGLVLCLLVFLKLEAQQAWNFYPQAGISCSFGTHMQRVGFLLRLQTSWQGLQVGSQALWHYNFKSFGSQRSGWEMQFAFHALYAWGRQDSLLWQQPFLQEGSNQTGRPHSLGYGYLMYRDERGSSQNSGFFVWQLRNFRFYFENDFLAFESRDRYRTGAISLSYRVNSWQFSLKNITYTGDPYSPYSPWIEDSRFPSRSGFIDMSSAPLGAHSTGILALQVQHALPINLGQETWPWYQYLALDLGCDAEQIRNLFQNKLIHDSKWLPLNWGDVKNPHIPMLCEDGCPYLYYPEQTLRKPRFYGQIQANAPVFY